MTYRYFIYDYCKCVINYKGYVIEHEFFYL